MRQIERNLLTSAMIFHNEAENLVKLVNEQPQSKYAELRITKAVEKITIGLTFLKALKMITCNHSKGKGDTTGVMWEQLFDDNGKKVGSFREVTKRCNNCNQVFYRKRYNLLRKRK